MQKRYRLEWKRQCEARRVRRNSLDLTLQTVAGRLGVSPPTISRWERAVMRPNVSMERAWDDALFKEAK